MPDAVAHLVEAGAADREEAAQNRLVAGRPAHPGEGADEGHLDAGRVAHLGQRREGIAGETRQGSAVERSGHGISSRDAACGFARAWWRRLSYGATTRARNRKRPYDTFYPPTRSSSLPARPSRCRRAASSPTQAARSASSE